MKLSFKIPKGVDENNMWSVNHQLHQLGLQPMKVEITKRMVHIDVGGCDQYISPESYVDACEEVFIIVTTFITENTNGE